MYGRRRYRRARRRREELKFYLHRILFGISVLCIIIVFAAVAFKTRKATQSVEAATALMQASTVAVKTETKDAAMQKQPEFSKDRNGKNGWQDAENEESAAEASRDGQASLIVIDPGHGGIDGGCVSGDVVEKEINRMIAARVVVKLRNMGYQAELAREGDTYVDKLERVEKANSRNALLYVSIHQNFCEDDSVAGIETWYDGSDTSRDSGRLAQLIQQETVLQTGAVSRELVSESELCVTSKSNMPSCLIETGFLSNREERGRLITEEYRDQLAEGIARGVDRYLNPRTMYLTFDDGPSEENTDRILDILQERNVKATFFVIGEYVRKYPETARRIVREGHAIGIHCDVHDYKTLYASVDSYMNDFQKAYDTVYEVTGVETRLFRFPGGSVNAFNRKVRNEIIEEMEKKGFIYYDWNASLEDAVGKEYSAERLVKNAVDTVLDRERVVLLAHDRVTQTADALPALLNAFPEYRLEPLTVQLEPVQF